MTIIRPAATRTRLMLVSFLAQMSVKSATQLPRRRDALALRRKRLDLDACAANRGAAVEDQITDGIALLAVGNADEFVSPGESDPGAHGENACKVPHSIKEVLLKGIRKSIPAEMCPDAVLRAAEGAVAVGAEIGATARKGAVDVERRGLRHAGQHGWGDHDDPGTFHALRLQFSPASVRGLGFKLRLGLLGSLIIWACLRMQ